MASRNRERWFPYEYFQLENEYNAKISPQKIAIAHGRSIGSIMTKLNTDSFWKRTFYHRGSSPWSVYEDQQLINELTLSLSTKEIANLHLRSVNSIRKRILQHAIYTLRHINHDISDIIEHFRVNPEDFIKHHDILDVSQQFGINPEVLIKHYDDPLPCSIIKCYEYQKHKKCSNQ